MEQFSGPHIAALIATAAIAGAAVAAARRGGEAWAVPIARVLAVAVLTSFALEQLTYVERGAWTARVNLPFQLSDAVTLISVLALWRPRTPVLVELAYFWAFTASLQAVLTPDLDPTFPDVLWFTYFGAHSGAIMAACLLVLGLRRLPRPGAAWRAYGITACFTALAAIATVLTGGNYMFLRHKPTRGSLLDVMGPWPVYILAGAAIALAMFVALAALARLLRTRERPTVEGVPARAGKR
ncbi:MAG: hypothetical protein QOH46_4121 [Solirubrobacteraceae bacterium]|jgi:hypothetical integral membrane protein (TIGR02206 family)|nr:hypothetical protein [Solirubrobacteraceae bacterium]